ncbi:MAG: hypothetical protein ABI639_02230 [Thermoanaerobaculia bacterium]
MRGGWSKTVSRSQAFADENGDVSLRAARHDAEPAKPESPAERARSSDWLGDKAKTREPGRSKTGLIPETSKASKNVQDIATMVVANFLHFSNLPGGFELRGLKRIVKLPVGHELLKISARTIPNFRTNQIWRFVGRHG